MGDRDASGEHAAAQWIRAHQDLRGIADQDERFAAICTPSEGKARWTPDVASRRVGQQV
jgi:hypothetical protein